MGEMDLSALDQFVENPEAPEKTIDEIDRVEAFDLNRKVLAFDQSLANTGYVLLVGSNVTWTGNLRSVEKLAGHAGSLSRVAPMHYEVCDVIIDTRPDVVVYETPPVGSRMMRPESSLMAATVIEIAAAKLMIPTEMIGAQIAKKRFTGNGNAKKAEVHKALKSLYPEFSMKKPMNEAILDAIAIGLVSQEKVR